jgi:Calx-beta domain
LFLVEGTNRRGLIIADQEQTDSTENRLSLWLTPGYYTTEVTTNTWSQSGSFSLYVTDGTSPLLKAFDTDNDGVGNNSDADDDNDGVIDIYDAFALDDTRALDSDNDGIDDSQDSTPYPAAGVIEISSAEFTVDEDGSEITIEVQRNHVQEGAASVFFFTEDQSAVANSDYLPAVGELTFAENELVKTVTIEIHDDEIYEAAETFKLRLGQASETAMLGKISSAVIVITEDDSVPSAGAVRWSSSEYAVDETTGSVSITAERLGDGNGELSVDYVTQDANAVAGMDYVARTGTLLFSDQEMTKVITIELFNDSIYEGVESFTVNLSNRSNGAVITAENTAVIHISDATSSAEQSVIRFVNTFVNTFINTKASHKEAQGLISLTLERVNGSRGVASVTWTTIEGTATAGLDFEHAEGVIEFHEGETNKTINIRLLDDSVFEQNEHPSASGPGKR